jgi:hypothetical protein
MSGAPCSFAAMAPIRVLEKRKSKSAAAISIISHEANGLNYCLVSDLNEKELAELANLFGR